MSWVFVFQICDIAINWAGGLHHAKKFEVSEEVMGDKVGKALSASLRSRPQFSSRGCFYW